MIYDFGCSVVSVATVAAGFGGAVAVLAIFVGLVSLGAVINRHNSFHAVDVLCGWAVVAAFLTLVVITRQHALLYASIALVPVSVAAIVIAFRRGYFMQASPFWLLALFPGLLILTAINLAGISKWDDFSHWVPNALYLFTYDSVPGVSLPPPHSSWPGYPYALPFLTYLASHLAGGFLIQGGAMMNFLLLFTFAAMLVEERKVSFQKQFDWQAIGNLSLALLLVTLANPAFNANFTVTNQGDTSTMVVLGALGLLFVRLLSAMGAADRGVVRKLLLQVTLVAVVFVLIKQVNLILLALLVFAFGVVAAKNKLIKPALMVVPAFIPALIIRWIWQHYVASTMTVQGFGIMPLASWHFDMMGDILRAMAGEMIKKNGLFILLWGLIIGGVINLFKPTTPLRNFVLFAAIVSSGYMAFLFLTYLGSNFSLAEIKRAASFYRYMTHVGLLIVAFIWMALPYLQNKFTAIAALPSLNSPRVTLITVFILPLMLLIHIGWLIPQTDAQTCAVRASGQETATALPADAHRLAVIDTDGNGLSTFMVGLDLALNELKTGHVAAIAWDINSFNSDALPARENELKNAKDVDAVVWFNPTRAAQNILGFNNDGGAVLLLRNETGWRSLVLAPRINAR